MKRIIAISSGEIKDFETLDIDKYIVKCCGKDNPSLLFIPTASHDAVGYIDTVNTVYSSLGCSVKSLELTTHIYTDKEISDLILSSDIVYVGGGDTLFLLKTWKEYNVNKYLIEAYNKGIILSGISAGGNCWFELGHRETEIEGKFSYSFISGLGLIPGVFCPHYDEEERKVFDHDIKNVNMVGYALDRCTALEYLDGDINILSVGDKYCAYKFENGKKVKLECILV